MKKLTLCVIGAFAMVSSAATVASELYNPCPRLLVCKEGNCDSTLPNGWMVRFTGDHKKVTGTFPYIFTGVYMEAYAGAAQCDYEFTPDPRQQLMIDSGSGQYSGEETLRLNKNFRELGGIAICPDHELDPNACAIARAK